ncbi:hypothetical protein I3843_13G079500 [Carya illinoinensis]|nr:hypothetical protein I3843_13G079500 [Carya illinoinensis]
MNSRTCQFPLFSFEISLPPPSLYASFSFQKNHHLHDAQRLTNSRRNADLTRCHHLHSSSKLTEEMGEGGREIRRKRDFKRKEGNRHAQEFMEAFPRVLTCRPSIG